MKHFYSHRYFYHLQNQSKSQPIKLNVLNNANGSQGNIQLVVDSRMGVILGSVAPAQGKPPLVQGFTSIELTI